MLDRRAFLASATGAATLAMPAIGHAEPTARLTSSRVLVSRTDNLADAPPTSYPSLATGPNKTLAAVWSERGARSQVPVMFQIFSQALEARSDPVVVGHSSQEKNILMTAAGGMVGMGSPHARTRAVTPKGKVAGVLTDFSASTPYSHHNPVIAPRSGGTYLASWTYWPTTGSSMCGCAGLVLGANGRRLSGFFDLFPPTESPDFPVSVNKLLPVTGGTLAVAQCVENNGVAVRMRMVADDGSLGPIITLADGVGFVFAGKSGVKDHVAVFWRTKEGNGLEGGLYRADGRKRVSYETLADAAAGDSAGYSFQWVTPDDQGRILCYAGGALFNVRTGALIARSSLPLDGMPTCLASIGGGRFAATTMNIDTRTSKLTTFSYA